MALDLSPSDRELCSQSTISRLENVPDTRALLRMGRAMVDLYCESFREVPKRIVLDIDDTFDAVYGGQQLRLFNAHYDEYGFQPIVVFDGEGRFVTAVLRPAKRPGGKEIRTFLRRLLRAIRTNWPNTQILLRADSHYCCPEVLDGVEPMVSIISWASRRPRRCTGTSRASRPARRRASRPRRRGRGRQLEPRRADRRPCGGQRGRARHTLHRHQPEGPQRPDEVMIFKALVLQALYNLSDDQAEYHLRDRLSFMRFLGLELEDTVPDAKTLWLYREALGKAGAVEELFDLFDGFLRRTRV